MQNDSWINLQGSYKGRPLLVRINSGLEPHLTSTDLRYQIGIAVPFLSADSNGFPSAAEVESLHAIEDRIYDGLAADGDTELAAVITTGGMREFVLYTRTPEPMKTELATLQAGITTHRVQVMMKEDAVWSTYRRFFPQAPS